MRYPLWLAVGVTAATVLAFVGASARENMVPASYVPGAPRMSRAAACGDTRALARHIWPDQDNITLAADLVAARKDTGSPVRAIESVASVWQVVCEDARDGSLGTVTWNASTNELVSVVAGSRDTSASGSVFPNMRRSETNHVLKRWMQTLAGARTGGAWQQIRRSMRGNVVSSEWIGAGRVARLCVNSATGELIIFRLANSLPQPQYRANL